MNYLVLLSHRLVKLKQEKREGNYISEGEKVKSLWRHKEGKWSSIKTYTSLPIKTVLLLQSIQKSKDIQATNNSHINNVKHRRVVLWFLVPQRIFFPHFMKKSIFYQLKNSEIRIPTFQDILLILCFMFIWKTTHISPAAMHTFARSQYNVRTYPLCPTNQYIYVKLSIDKVI